MSRVLLIEDESLVALYLQSLLSDLGCDDVVIATTEEEACRAAETADLDLVLADVNLGAGGNGIAAVRKIRAAHHCPVVFITGNPDQVRGALLDEEENVGLVEKPLSPAVLRAAVVAYL